MTKNWHYMLGNMSSLFYLDALVITVLLAKILNGFDLKFWFIKVSKLPFTHLPVFKLFQQCCCRVFAKL